MKVTVRIFNNPALRCDETGLCFVLLEAMACSVQIQPGISRPEGILKIVVTEGFETDFASIPRLFHFLIPKLGRYNLPAILHDYLYVTGKVSKDLADRIFLAAMEAAGVGRLCRETMFVAVRYFGWRAWNAYRRTAATDRG